MAALTQYTRALQGEITEEMRSVATQEGRGAEEILQGIAQGTIVIPVNNLRPRGQYCGIGAGLKTKVNANIGTSRSYSDISEEKLKLAVSIESGADAVMDLSTGSNIDRVRQELIKDCQIAFGTVPIYQAAVEAVAKRGGVVHMEPAEILAAIKKQAEDGVDFMTVHAGLTLATLERLQKDPRITDVVSRGGSFLLGWMLQNEKENPFYEYFDDILAIAGRYDVTLSLGDALRPGCVADATDRSQIHELIILGELVDRCRDAGVQVIVEGPGHVPLDQVATNIKLQKRLCHNAPFYVLGPLVTDVAPGYDHITAAIGGAIAAAAGADFLCYVTPAEHLGLPDEEAVRQGIMASRIAGHAADVVKGVQGAGEWDLAMAKARKDLNWAEQKRLAIDPRTFEQYTKHRDETGCSMCGPYCSMKIVSRYLGRKTGPC
ncbi:phosphomethylpyrimidine synthase ThiC [Desulfoscipio sp. XC116]|uniref:phosphomethylpyrimidine synthase ThiC n=1 Tax=Desulfoscipio sp. XC116 TaxID=3144975 RepID=UPI00325A8DC7